MVIIGMVTCNAGSSPATAINLKKLSTNVLTNKTRYDILILS